ncbi:protoporphyrinogen oxidase [Alicyclobacillus sp. ALC3]|uniref:protoporphyrinogen oxidase n=1 Tax=Alicyclobacillus sp. ALC3 TaxID=2796143 RepID=UPI002378266A|nr:protoporphyrinogen oxidase [Alicyclobacillus sp. ALC3]WDL96201.1 protoporphyrinogen oxidase [Alicyclobacillus sp. ALC3]
MKSQDVVIVGGGITGLTAAYRLKQLADARDISIHCTVLEQGDRFGGKIFTHRQDGFVLERGPDSLLARKEAATRLIRDLGLESEMVGTNPNPKAQKTYMVYRGQLTPMPAGTNMGIPADLGLFMKTELLSGSEKARALMDMVLPRGHQDKDQSVGAFLRRRLGDAVVERICEPLQAGIYAGSIDHLSLQTTFPQFLELERKYRSIIIGSRTERQALLARLEKAKQASASSGAATDSAPIGAAAGRSTFVTVRHGLQSIIERLYDELADWADLRTLAPVIDVSARPDGSYSVSTIREGVQETLHADTVICATPAMSAAQILKQISPQAAAEIAQIEYVSTATVILVYRENQVPGELDASGFLVPRTENRAITASTWLSSKWPHTTPDGHIVIRCYVGRAGQQSGLELDDPGIVEAVRAELKSLLHLDAKPQYTLVTRWNHAMPQYQVGHLKRVERAEQALAQSAPGVYIAGAGYYGIGVPDCIRHGEQVAASALDYLTGAAVR